LALNVIASDDEDNLFNAEDIIVDLAQVKDGGPVRGDGRVCGGL
jgi:hypothetical protein